MKGQAHLLEEELVFTFTLNPSWQQQGSRITPGAHTPISPFPCLPSYDICHPNHITNDTCIH
jgi:hypothetical protein